MIPFGFAVLAIIGALLVGLFVGSAMGAGAVVAELRRYRGMFLAGGDREAIDRLLAWIGGRR